jgi:paraquat-inducible protein B
MTAPTNHWKLGLFVVVGLLVGISAVVYLGSRALPHEAMQYTSFFDETVTGLDTGSSVRYRGVNIGSVSSITIAPDRRHVAVTYELTTSVLSRLGLSPGGENNKLYQSRDLRAQITQTGVTGVKYLQLDFFDPEAFPPPKLPFPVPENYIPAAQSTLKNLEDTVVRTVDRFPEIAEQVMTITTKVNRMLDDIDRQQLPARLTATMDGASATLKNADRVLLTLDTKLNQLDAKGLSSDARATLNNLNGTIDEMHALLGRFNGERGLLASAQRATDSVGDVASNAGDLTGDLEQTMRDVREMSQSIRALVDALELDSDMLLKGRAKAVPP